jgi:hypothetical protein
MVTAVFFLKAFLHLSQSIIFAQSDRTFLVQRLDSGPEVDFTDFPDFSAIYIISDVPSLRISSEISLVTRIVMSHTDNILIVTPTTQRIVFEALGYESQTLSLPILRPREVVWVRVNEFVNTAVNALLPNREGLPDINRSTLVGLVRSGVYLEDQQRQVVYIPIGGRVYLGSLEKISLSLKTATFQIMRGGITETVILKISEN